VSNVVNSANVLFINTKNNDTRNYED